MKERQFCTDFMETTDGVSEEKKHVLNVSINETVFDSEGARDSMRLV